MIVLFSVVLLFLSSISILFLTHHYFLLSEISVHERMRRLPKYRTSRKRMHKG